jgi:AcrR family transcriptional regulator
MPEPATVRAGARRARPLPPGARRAALVAATLPLIRQRGFDVTTRQLAAAARVAEGTIFRVFPDKESLICATLVAAFDPAPVVAGLERIDRTAPLPERLTVAAGIVQEWLTSLIGLMTTLHRSRGARHKHKPALERLRPLEVVSAALARLIEPDRARLRVSPSQAARWLGLLLFSASHPLLTEGAPLSPAEIAGVILDGVRHHRGGMRAERGDVRAARARSADARHRSAAARPRPVDPITGRVTPKC